MRDSCLLGQGSGSTSKSAPTSNAGVVVATRPMRELQIPMPRVVSSEVLVQVLSRLLLERRTLDTFVLHPRFSLPPPPAHGPVVSASASRKAAALEVLSSRLVRKRARSGILYERCLSMPLVLPLAAKVRERIAIFLQNTQLVLLLSFKMLI